MNRITGLLLVTLLVTPLTLSGGTAEAKKMMAPKTAAISTAVTPEILDAVGAELERAMARMRIPGAPAPYFIGYKLTEVDVHDVVASLGSLLDESDRDLVSLEAHVHVGSYDKDNSNFVASRRESLDGNVIVPLALEASPRRARRSAWIATDAAYKEAIGQWQAKGEAIASGAAAGNSKVASYTKTAPIVMESQVKVPLLDDNEALGRKAMAVSKAFRDFSFIRDSRVAYTSFLENRWYLNSEGTSATDTRRVEGVLIVATAQASDGQEISLYFSRYAYSSSELPSIAELQAEAKGIASRLKAMIDAPVIENYTGPVLFEGEGAVGIVRHTLATHLTGTPPPVGISSTDALLAGKLAGRKGMKVVSSLLDITDDPTTMRVATSKGMRHVIGSYRFDDEGVAPKRIDIIKKGKLSELPMSRTPSAEQGQSNGHARLSMPGGVFRGTVTNLQLSSKKKSSTKQLRKALLKEAKSQGLPYAIVIKQFDDVAITANTEISRLALYQILQSMNSQAPPQATLAYRVYANGKEELVRGVQLDPVDMRSWRNVIGVGRDSTLKNFLASTDDAFGARLIGRGTGRVPSAGIESSISTPDLLFQELDIRATKFGLRPKALIPPP